MIVFVLVAEGRTYALAVRQFSYWPFILRNGLRLYGVDWPLKYVPSERYIPRVPASKKRGGRQFNVGDKVRVNLHHGKIEDAVVRAVIQDDDGIKL